MSSPRRLSIGSLSRVEGQGALRVRVGAEGVEIAEFNIYEPPRFFERLLCGREIHEVPDIVARICGICPVAYQLTACGALEKAVGIAVGPEIRALRRLLTCGEWLQSHALHIHLLHAPDFLGFESGFTMAAEHPAFLERGLRLKGLGSRIIEVVGGRAVHPVNVVVGGFSRAPSAAALRNLVPELEWGLEAAQELVRTVARFTFPEFRHDAACVSLRADDAYPLEDGRIVCSGGPGVAPLDIPPEEYRRHFVERQVPWSTALHSLRLPGERPYLTGPQARLTNCHASLPPLARRAADASGIGLPLASPFRSIVARAVELVAACEEAVAIARTAVADLAAPRVVWRPRAGRGCHATEAPRGLLYHDYEIDADGLVTKATIIPPTSQNQAQIEADLRALLAQRLDLDDAAATEQCERLIRSYDPCISCATHFLRLSIDRPPLP